MNTLIKGFIFLASTAINEITSEEYFVFNGKIFTNGSRPVISSNISDEKIVEKISNILNDYSEEKFIKKNYLKFRQRNLETSQPSLETEKWAVYWDTDNADWYFYNKIFNYSTWYKPAEMSHISLMDRSKKKEEIGRSESGIPKFLPRPDHPPPYRI